MSSLAQESIEFDERVNRHAAGAILHARARDRIKHPRRDHHNHAGQAPLRSAQSGRRDAARCDGGERSGRKGGASDNGPRHPARHGQNDREIALGRRAWLFAGSDRGAERAAVMFTLITTAKLNDVDPQAWLADVFARIAEIPQSRLHELLPWHWNRQADEPAAARAA